MFGNSFLQYYLALFELFWHVSTCCELLLVLKNFEMSQNLSFLNKPSYANYHRPPYSSPSKQRASYSLNSTLTLHCVGSTLRLKFGKYAVVVGDLNGDSVDFSLLGKRFTRTMIVASFGQHINWLHWWMRVFVDEWISLLNIGILL